jgi:hypothetical protein
MTATPRGFKKLAAVPTPSADPGFPLPASVLTMPPGYVTSRIRLLFVSATTTIVFGEEKTATQIGLKKLAEVPTPSANPP